MLVFYAVLQLNEWGIETEVERKMQKSFHMFIQKGMAAGPLPVKAFEIDNEASMSQDQAGPCSFQ